MLYFRLFTFSYLYWVRLSVFSCTVLFVSISQVIGCKDRLRNDLYSVEWGVKLYSNANIYVLSYVRTHTHPFNGPFLGLPGWAGTRKVKSIRILLKQETVSGSGISWAICKSAPRCRQITTPVPHHSVFYRPDTVPVKALKALCLIWELSRLFTVLYWMELVSNALF